MPLSDAQLRQAYADLIEPPDDPALLRLTGLLDAEYRSTELPSSLSTWVPAVPATGYQRSSGTGAPRRRRRLLPRVASVAGVVIACVIALAVSQSLATVNPANLGPPTDAAPPYLPLGSFQRVGAPLYQGGKVELLFISSQADAYAAAERWPIVKALGQFGTFSGLRPTVSDRTRSCPGVPTYDFTHAVYRSRYITFIHRDLQGYDPRSRANSYQPLQKLNAEESSLLRRYGGVGLSPEASSAPAGVSKLAYRLRFMSPPMELVGGYVLNGAYAAYGEMVPASSAECGGGFQPQSPPEPAFGQIQRALLAGYRNHADRPYVFDVDVETNVITALVCHADKGRPASVCHRRVITEIMRRIK